jgi:hypothetical protein
MIMSTYVGPIAQPLFNDRIMLEDGQKIMRFLPTQQVQPI